MKQAMKQVLSWILVISLVLGLLPAVHASGVRWEKTDLEITAQMSDRLIQKDESAERDPGEKVRVSIVLDKPSAVQAGYATMGIAANTRAMDYRAQLLSTQKRMERTISTQALMGQPLDVVWNMTLVGNLISAWVPYGSLEDIAAIRGVKSVTLAKTVARLSIRPLESGLTTVSIVTDLLGNQESGNEERLDLVLEVEKPHEHSYEAVVTAPTCTEGGYTTYTCDCGESYMAEETPALGHDWDGSSCTRCDAARENPFVDVPEGSFYYDAVLWAAQEGIAAGLDATHFGPNAACTRAQVVTFLHRTKA